MKMVCLLIIILLLCFIIFNTRKAGFNQIRNNSNSKEHFYQAEICDLTNIDKNKSIITEHDAININNIDSCTKLDLSDHENLTTIGDQAFENNNNLTEIILPKSITTIGQAAFEGCQRIQSIIIKELVEGNQCPSNNDTSSKAGKLKKLILDSLDYTVKNNIECKVLN